MSCVQRAALSVCPSHDFGCSASVAGSAGAPSELPGVGISECVASPDEFFAHPDFLDALHAAKLTWLRVQDLTIR